MLLPHYEPIKVVTLTIRMVMRITIILCMQSRSSSACQPAKPYTLKQQNMKVNLCHFKNTINRPVSSSRKAWCSVMGVL